LCGKKTRTRIMYRRVVLVNDDDNNIIGISDRSRVWPIYIYIYTYEFVSAPEKRSGEKNETRPPRVHTPPVLVGKRRLGFAVTRVHEILRKTDEYYFPRIFIYIYIYYRSIYLRLYAPRTQFMDIIQVLKTVSFPYASLHAFYLFIAPATAPCVSRRRV